MKRTFLILATLFLGITTANAQWWGSEKVKGNGDMEKQTRSTSDYEKIKLQGSMDMELVAGREGQIIVEAESNLQEYILTEVENGILKISTEKGYNLKPSNDMEIRITVPFEDLEGVALTGSGDVMNADRISARSFEAEVTGSGDMELNLDVENLEASINGSGDINLRGTASTFTCKVNGSGDISAYDLKAKNVEARVSGSGDIQVYASRMLEARVAGSGDITYRGNPEKEDFKTTGSGSVSSD